MAMDGGVLAMASGRQGSAGREKPNMPHSTYLPHCMGSVGIDPTGCFDAGSFQSFTLTYTTGYFGVDDTGSIKIVHRFASDMGKPQFHDPGAPNYLIPRTRRRR